MKILYIISTFKGGNGGHAYSLKHISNEVAKYTEVSIISIGPKRSKVVTTSPHYREYIYFNGINIFQFKSKLKKILLNYQPDILHCFDTNAYNVIKLLTPSSKYKFVLNKCGGPNKVDFPVSENLILFSVENEFWFKSKEKYNLTNISLIPNRVQKLQLSTTLESVDFIQRDSDEFTFVRIARLGKAYKKGILDAINLIKKLTQDSYNVCLYIIGVVECENVLNDLRTASKGANVRFLTDDKYTIGASKMLYLADAVIATGRGLMEATSLGIPILTPSESAKIPVLVSEANFEKFLATNFSERNQDDQYDERLNLENIKRLIIDRSFYEEQSTFAIRSFNKHFDITEGARQYINVYHNSLNRELEFSRFKDIILKMKSLYGFYKYSKQ